MLLLKTNFLLLVRTNNINITTIKHNYFLLLFISDILCICCIKTIAWTKKLKNVNKILLVGVIDYFTHSQSHR